MLMADGPSLERNMLGIYTRPISYNARVFYRRRKVQKAKSAKSVTMPLPEISHQNTESSGPEIDFCSWSLQKSI